MWAALCDRQREDVTFIHISSKYSKPTQRSWNRVSHVCDLFWSYCFIHHSRNLFHTDRPKQRKVITRGLSHKLTLWQFRGIFFFSNPASCFHMFTALIHAARGSHLEKRIKMQQAEATLQHLSQNEIKCNWHVIKKKNHIKGAGSFLAPVLEQRSCSCSLASFCSPHAEMAQWAVGRWDGSFIKSLKIFFSMPFQKQKTKSITSGINSKFIHANVSFHCYMEVDKCISVDGLEG